MDGFRVWLVAASANEEGAVVVEYGTLVGLVSLAVAGTLGVPGLRIGGAFTGVISALP